MAVGLARRERARDYGTATCAVCGETFERRSGNSITCGRPACRRARKTEQARRHEAKRRTKRRLQPHEAALRDVALQLVYDHPRSLGFEQAEARWRALATCRENLADPDAEVALRAHFIDLAAAAVLIAAKLPPPTVPLRLDSSAKQQVAALTATAMAVD